jgi:farnesyl diphosphate synthase
MPQPFAARLEAAAAETDVLLNQLLSADLMAGETARPERLLDAMRYASLGGGKRLRPFLVVESAALFGVPRERALMAGAALECVHCYSLVHDDLPAMDDDDLRRGRPSLHRAFDEATAILAGDSLLTLAFEVMADPRTHEDAALRCRLIARLAEAAGHRGMAGGQMLDLGGRALMGQDEAQVLAMQAMKTGALIAFACAAGALLGRASEDEQRALQAYAGHAGLAFQIADDILDVEAAPAELGKATGKDAARGKATFVTLYGLAGARQRCGDLVAQALAALAPFGARADALAAAARFMVGRRS